MRWIRTKFAEVRDWLRRFPWHSHHVVYVRCTICRTLKSVTDEEYRPDKMLYCHVCGRNTHHKENYYDHEDRQHREIDL